MMNLFDDFKDLLAAFEASSVEFVLLGGYAVAFHGRPRSTKDIDLLIGLSDENRAKAAEALQRFGAPAVVVTGARRLQEGEVVYFGVSPLRVDILASASGIDFASVYERAVETSVDGVKVRVIALEDLITNKIASGRPQDLEDVRGLRRMSDEEIQ